MLLYRSLVGETSLTLLQLRQLAAVACGLAFLIVPSPAQSPKAEIQIPLTATIELIDFEGLNDSQLKIISKRISLRIGDILSSEARQRVASELAMAGQELGKTLTFSYKPGSKVGTVKFKISDGC